MVVIRGSPNGVELFCVKRHAKSGFLGGAVVFPGGKVAEADRSPAWVSQSTPLGERAGQAATDVLTSRAFAIAALRELFEEAGILPLSGVVLDDGTIDALRADLATRTSGTPDDALAFMQLLGERGFNLDVGALELMARWVTPLAEERRFDTRFYVLAAPEGQSGKHDAHETTASFWGKPQEILDAWANDELFLAPPTLQTVQLLASASDIEHARVIARAHPLEPICPFFAMDGECMVLALPGDPLFPEPSAAPENPEAPTRFVLEQGRFVPRRVNR